MISKVSKKLTAMTTVIQEQGLWSQVTW